MLDREGNVKEKLEALVAAYQHSLHRICFLLLQDEELAKDAVQETFLKAYRGLSSFRNEANEKTWITRIAVNTCRDLRRSAWFRHIDRKVALDSLSQQAVPVENREREIVEAMMELPDKLRTTAILVWYQGLEVQEAAKVLGISHQAVSKRLSKCRKNLKSILEDADDGFE